MTIGTPDYNAESGPNPEYQMLINIRDRVSSVYDVNNLKLSMGMSKDFIHANSKVKKIGNLEMLCANSLIGNWIEKWKNVRHTINTLVGIQRG
ncbi:hypothetical protein JTE90_022962 [Oedothorax gibbosus]|uniref:Uncharacterized protein n=1 Tax=Oedothorax gibbosus TaxID=931172 RepID=A0AAV6V9M2_9ARAC|nr:hypothetical protein JTE90_022962 [Oedothorax gibbosus]